MSRERWMSLLFATGSLCFLVGPFPGYAQLVGATADAVTFFVGSIFFTAGGALQVWLSYRERRAPGEGRAEWWAAVVQSAGTLFFNATTYRALHTSLSDSDYDRLVWRPDAFGSICFLVSGFIAYRASHRRGWLPARGGPGWWMPAVNLLGCIFFGISAVAGYVVPSRGSVLDLAAANWNTSLGAACFLACALPGLRSRQARSRSRTVAPVQRHPSLDERFDPAIRIVDHDPEWPRLAREELERVATALGAAAVRLEHVGSTSVPGLGAKPIIDMQVSVVDIERLDDYVGPLAELGYLFAPDPAFPDYHYFARPHERPRTHHLHVCEQGSHQEVRHLAVRDYLCAHPEEAARYEALKRELVREHPEDRLAYVAGKDEFMVELEARAMTWATA
jgi:GrpB-like predicted nucleotidyltransferase (UPF0157 family)